MVILAYGANESEYENWPMEQYEKALAIEPEHPAIHRNLGILLSRLGRNEEAIPHLRKVLQLVPNEPSAREILDMIEAQRQ